MGAVWRFSEDQGMGLVLVHHDLKKNCSMQEGAPLMLSLGGAIISLPYDLFLAASFVTVQYELFIVVSSNLAISGSVN